MKPFKFKRKLLFIISGACILLIFCFVTGCSSTVEKTSSMHAVRPELDENGAGSSDLGSVSGEVEWSELALAIREQAYFHFQKGVDYCEKSEYGNSERELEAALDVILDADTRPELHRELVQLYNEFFDRVERFKREHFPEEENGFKNGIAHDLDADRDVNTDEPGLTGGVSPGCEKLSAIPVVYNSRVKHFIEFLTVTNKTKTERSLSRGTRYIDFMRRILREEGVPEDFVFLVLIESAYKTNAYSYAHACGLWQFIRATGRRYNLDVTWWVDERRDPEKSTRAAARYLKDLYAEFDCWLLSVASYNTGEARVRKAVARSGSRDIWTIIHERRIPRQTRNYVPAFLAAIEVGKNPRKYGLQITQETPYSYDEVTVHDSVDLRVIARCCGSDYQTVKDLNPELRRFYTPKLMSGYKVKIPADSKNQFLLAYSKLPDSDKLTWNRHQVNRGETLSIIASRYGVSVTDLMYANNIRNAHLINTGTLLLIPSGPDQKPPSSYADTHRVSPDRNNSSHGKPSHTPSSHSNAQKIRYRVVRGDSLYSIALKFNTTITRICRWNNISRQRTLYPGTTLTLYGAGITETAERTGNGQSGTVYSEKSGEEKRNERNSDSDRDKRVHVIRYGDTLYDIAKNYRVSIDQIIKWNNLKSHHHIYPGDRLHIYGYPEQTFTHADTDQQAQNDEVYRRKITYLVKSGDTLWDIAKEFNTYPDQIRLWNKPRNLQVIRPGDKLTIFVN